MSDEVEHRAAEERRLREDVGAVEIARDVVRVSGPEAVGFLHGQLSQEVEALPVGGSAWSLILQPQGRIVALVRVTRVADDAVLLDVDGGWGEAVVARLQRFKLRTKADIERLDWGCVALRGPGAAAVAAGMPEVPGVLVVPADWPGAPGVDLLGEAPAVPEGVLLCRPEALEAVRVGAGVPAMGAELTERTIPAEAGVVERTVSFTKGCYTGQELVARLDARGSNVARHLRSVVLPAGALPPTGAVLVDAEGTEVGALTSVAPSAARDATLALAYVRRGVELPADLTVRWEGGTATGRVAPLAPAA